LHAPSEDEEEEVEEGNANDGVEEDADVDADEVDEEVHCGCKSNSDLYSQIRLDAQKKTTLNTLYLERITVIPLTKVILQGRSFLI
jgi:hypothetical protein